jgi:hypothetical protein
MASEELEAVAASFAAIAEELEKAAAHARRAGEHFGEREVPRGSAHAMAVRGHLRRAEKTLAAIEELHATRSRV